MVLNRDTNPIIAEFVFLLKVFFCSCIGLVYVESDLQAVRVQLTKKKLIRGQEFTLYGIVVCLQFYF